MLRFRIAIKAAVRNTKVKLFKMAFIKGRIVTSKASKSSTPGIPANTPIAPISTTEIVMIAGR